MSKSVRETLAREAVEVEAVADAEDRGETRKAGQRARQPAEPSQVYSLRLPAAAITQLRAVAEKAEAPPTALLRRFVLERLAVETRRQEHAADAATTTGDRLSLPGQSTPEATHDMSEPAADARPLMTSQPGPDS